MRAMANTPLRCREERSGHPRRGRGHAHVVSATVTEKL